MTPRGSIAKCVAVSVAIILHISLAQPWDTDQTALNEAGAGVASARLGSSFADMTAGTAQPASPTETIEPIMTEQIVAPSAASGSIPRPDLATANEPIPVLISPVRATTHLAGVTANARPVAPAAERLTAIDPSSLTHAQTTTRRPQMRPLRAAFAKQKTDDIASNKPSRSSNGSRTTLQGSVTGQEPDKAKSQGSERARAAKTGTAAVSNYPGQVMRRIARLRRPDTRVRGTAVIAFTISPSGDLASAHVARSSGSAALDSAAIRLVRRAAPFPPPPAGARRSHSVGIKGRG